MNPRLFRSVKRQTVETQHEATLAQLNEAARHIGTREQFEHLARQSANPDGFRRLVGAMLRRNLPCCTRAPFGSHSEGCPGLPEVPELHDESLARFEGEGGLVETGA